MPSTSLVAFWRKEVRAGERRDKALHRAFNEELEGRVYSSALAVTSSAWRPREPRKCRSRSFRACGGKGQAPKSTAVDDFVSRVALAWGAKGFWEENLFVVTVLKFLVFPHQQTVPPAVGRNFWKSILTRTCAVKSLPSAQRGNWAMAYAALRAPVRSPIWALRAAIFLFDLFIPLRKDRD